MIKRILIDFHLLKTIFPNISCYLFQLESQLGGELFRVARNYIRLKIDSLNNELF